MLPSAGRRVCNDNSPGREEFRNDVKLNAHLRELDLNEQKLMKQIKQFDDTPMTHNYARSLLIF